MAKSIKRIYIDKSGKERGAGCCGGDNYQRQTNGRYDDDAKQNSTEEASQ
jgi:hypothetical protein